MNTVTVKYIIDNSSLNKEVSAMIFEKKRDYLVRKVKIKKGYLRVVNTRNGECIICIRNGIEE